MTARDFFDQLNQDYVTVAGDKEELFWATRMGTSDDQRSFAAAEKAYKRFVSDPDTLAAVEARLAEARAGADSANGDQLIHGLEGWLTFFELNAIEDDASRELEAQLVDDDTELFARRKQLDLRYRDPGGKEVPASTLVLGTNLAGSDDEGVRKSSHDALLELERWVLDNGFLDMVRRRNELARAQGYRDFFDYKVNKNERMTPEALFAILDEFEGLTREAHGRSLEALAAQRGTGAILPHNLRYSMAGDVTRQMDRYLPFARSLERWVTSFGRLGVQFRDATLTLDLLDRKGKYENGFMHAPRVAWRDNGCWSPAVINFTSNANPDRVGSGAAGLKTLFHEGGHAAHFANIAQNAPCFSQEYPPTTMSYAETQSMFFDSLLGDADWLALYARTRTGEAMPEALIRAAVERRQPFAPYDERRLLVVPYVERAIYAMRDDELRPEHVLATARQWEQAILGIDAAPRPTLAIPHLLDMGSACSYQGYLLAHMAVHQTRAYFLREHGFLTDNPRVGPLLSRCYWAPGNSVTQDRTLRDLTGEGLTGRYLAEHCNRAPADAWRVAQAQMAAALSRPQPDPVPLDAHIRVVHGAELIADNTESDATMFAAFERWIDERYPASS